MNVTISNASIATTKAAEALQSAIDADLSARQASAGNLILSVAGKIGTVTLNTSDIIGYQDPVALSLVFGA